LLANQYITDSSLGNARVHIDVSSVDTLCKFFVKIRKQNLRRNKTSTVVSMRVHAHLLTTPLMKRPS
jgi:hypothetical protein